MSTELAQIGVEYGVVLLLLIALTLLLNRLGVLAWIWWVSRCKHADHDSAARQYWDLHS